MWKISLDPFITIIPVDTPAILPILIQIPNFQPSIHICVYLPTAGKESEFLIDLSKLDVLLDDLEIKFSNPPVFIQGDANSRRTNAKRHALLTSFCSNHNLARVPIGHNTYHPFVGSGQSDSELDILLHSNQDHVRENLLEIQCREVQPLVDSHHDLLVSCSTVPRQSQSEKDKSQNIVAPKVLNKRQKVIWSEEGIGIYNQLISSLLPDLRERWLSSTSEASVSVLIQSTNFLMDGLASSTNKAVSLASIRTKRSEKVPKQIKKSSNALAKAHSKMKLLETTVGSNLSHILEAQNLVEELRRQHRSNVRQRRMMKLVLKQEMM